jgi:hypothetical protein
MLAKRLLSPCTSYVSPLTQTSVNGVKTNVEQKDLKKPHQRDDESLLSLCDAPLDDQRLLLRVRVFFQSGFHLV